MLRNQRLLLLRRMRMNAHRLHCKGLHSPCLSLNPAHMHSLHVGNSQSLIARLTRSVSHSQSGQLSSSSSSSDSAKVLTLRGHRATVKWGRP